MTVHPEIVVLPSKTELVELVCARFEEVVQKSIAAHGRCVVVLSGGSTPKALYERLASPDWIKRFEWEKVVFFFGDDRAVSPEDELSNYKMAHETLLGHVKSSVHRLEGERADLEEAAKEYAQKIEALNGPFDLVLNGLGPDGHTASLFPHTSQVQEEERLVVATEVASLQPYVRRLTLTFPALNNSRHSWFLVTGADKAVRVRQTLRAEKPLEEVPARGIAPQNGELVWFLDQEAAKDAN